MQLNVGCDDTVMVEAIYAEVYMVHDVFINLLFLFFFFFFLICRPYPSCCDVIVVHPCTAHRNLQMALFNNKCVGATAHPRSTQSGSSPFFLQLFFRRSDCSCGGKRKEVATG